MIPNYVTIVNMGLKENLLGIVLPTAATAFAILNLFQVLRPFPKRSSTRPAWTATVSGES